MKMRLCDTLFLAHVLTNEFIMRTLSVISRQDEQSGAKET